MTKPIEPGDVLWADLDGNHKIDQLDRVKVGNIYPKWTGGFSTTLSYKNVSLYGRFDFALGHTILNMVAMRSLGQSVGFKNIIKEALKTWRSSRFYEKGDYLALRELTLNWKLPVNWISKMGMTNASVYITGQNLFYITGYSGSSPEAPLTYPGVDAGRYPTPRTVLVGASVSF